jgi:hypothetical protein
LGAGQETEDWGGADERRAALVEEDMAKSFERVMEEAGQGEEEFRTAKLKSETRK